MSDKKKINRREFLKRSSRFALGAAALPAIIPSTVLGKDGGIAPSERITIGCIGVGSMGTSNLRSFLANDTAHVLAVCDVDRRHYERAKKLTDEKYGNSDCATYGDYRDLLARKDIDAVMIATPDHWHGILATEAARAGKDIYAEKPLAYSIPEGRAICDAVERYGTIWQTGSWQRSQRNFRFAAELVRNGCIGKVHTVRVGLPQGNNVQKISTELGPVPEGFDYDMWLGPAPWRPYAPGRCHWNFRWISDYSGGQLTDWAGHHVDIANWGMDTETTSPKTIKGQGIFPPAKEGIFDTPESYYFECEYDAGFTMIVADSEQQPKGMGAHFQGTEGWVHVQRGGIDAYPKNLLETKFSPNEIHLYNSNDHVENFLDCVKSRQETITPARVAHQAIMIGHLGTIAMKLGRKLRWDGNTERFINDPEANRLLIRPMRSPWRISV